jgi:type IV secretory pathway VirB4 component
VIGAHLRRRMLARRTHPHPDTYEPAAPARPAGPGQWHDPQGSPSEANWDASWEAEPESGAWPDPDEFTPGGVGVGARVVRHDGGLVAVLAVTAYPDRVYPGWLAALLAHPRRLDVSLHINPIDPLVAKDRLKRRRSRLAAGLSHDAEHGRVADPTAEAADEGAADLAAAIARGQARIFNLSLYLAVHAADAEELAAEVHAVRKLAASLMLDARPASYRQLDAWQACLPVGVDRLAAGRVMDTDPIAAAAPFASDELPGPDPVNPHPPEGVFYGLAPTSNGLVFRDEFAGENYSTVVLGPSGTGKSYFVKASLLRSLYRQVHGHQVQAVTVDPEDEYTPLTHAIGGTVIRIGAPGVRINPLDVPIHEREDGGRHAHRDALARRALFVDTFVSVLLGVELDPTSRAVLDEACAATYARAGIHPDDPDTWLRPAPILADLAAVLAEHPDPAGDTLATQLRPYTVGAWSGVFNGHSTSAPTGRLVSWSLREMPDELRAPGTLLVLDHIWRQVDDPTQLRPRIVVIDEAWRLMKLPVAAEFLQAMAKTFRKRWAALRFVSQEVIDVLNTDLGLAIIDNADTTILMRQKPQTIDELARLYGLTAGEQSYLLRAGRGEALVITPDHRVAVKILASPVEDELITTDPAQLAELADHDTDSYIELPVDGHAHDPAEPPMPGDGPGDGTWP